MTQNTEEEHVTSAMKKGRRNENEARNIQSRVWRHVERVDGYGNTDPFNLADLWAMDPQLGVLITQVKTNRFTKKDRRHVKSRASMYVPDSVDVEVWVRVDYEGWRMYRLDRGTEEYEEFLRMDTCDRDATVEAYRDAVPYYPKRVWVG